MTTGAAATGALEVAFLHFRGAPGALEVGRLVVQTTATVTGKVLTPEDQKRLAEETSRQLT